MKKKILYIGWLGYGNLGDDACFELFKKKVRATLSPEQKVEIHAASPTKGFTAESLRKLSPDLVVLGGGSIIVPPFSDLLVTANKLNIPTTIWGSGIDRLSAGELARVQQNKLLKSIQSYAPKIPAIRVAVGGCRSLGVRGPHTLKILESISCPVDINQISGDPGLLLRPRQTTSINNIVQWLNQHPDVIAVNWGTSLNKVYGLNEQATQTKIAAALNTLAQQHSLFLYAVWPRDLAPLRSLAAQIKTPNLYVGDRVPSAEELGYLYQHVQMTINFKLHANIFSAAVGCPFISLAYRSKCYDFAASVDCEDFVLSFDDPQLDLCLIAACERLYNEREAIQKRIKKQKDLYCRRLNRMIHQYIQWLF